MIERPLAVVVTGLTHVAGRPAAGPPVARSSCFQTILFVAGLNATSREMLSAFGADDVRHSTIWPALLITGCWSAAGGASSALLKMFAQTTSIPEFGSQAGSGHSTPPLPGDSMTT